MLLDDCGCVPSWLVYVCAYVQRGGLEWRDALWGRLYGVLTDVTIRRVEYSVKAALLLGSEKEVRGALRNRQKTVRPVLAEYESRVAALTSSVVSVDELWKSVPSFNANSEELRAGVTELLGRISSFIPQFPVTLEDLESRCVGRCLRVCLCHVVMIFGVRDGGVRSVAATIAEVRLGIPKLAKSVLLYDPSVWLRAMSRRCVVW